MTRFLPDGQTIRKEVRRIFNAEKGRRVALVAFVGRNAGAYLPRPKGLELVCWPQAPGTDPATVRFLLKKKVEVRFAKRLHMKVYWTKSRGAIVTSANLSTNAYGAGSLHEAGVLLPSSYVDIDFLLKPVAPERVTESALAKLKRAAERATRSSLGHRERTTFLHWLSKARRRGGSFVALIPTQLFLANDFGLSPKRRQEVRRCSFAVLKFELNFLERGGYDRSPREPWKPSLVFEDSPTCMNYDTKADPEPCDACVLMQLVPPEARGEKVPCRHIPITPEGGTVDYFYRWGTQEELEGAMKTWLRKKIQELEAGQSQSERKAHA